MHPLIAEFTAEQFTAIIVALITVAGSSAIAAVSAVRNRRDMRTSNGRSTGQTIEETAQTTEVIQAQQHGVAREFEQVHGRLGRIEEKVDRIDGRVDRLDTRVEKHLTDDERGRT